LYKLPILKKQIDFKLNTYSEEVEDDKIKFWFEIKTNKTIKSIYFKNNKDYPLTLIPIDDGYKTKPRRKKLDPEKNILIIKFNDKMTKTFNCYIIYDNSLQCYPIKKINL
jgi:hypothetical protein